MVFFFIITTLCIIIASARLSVRPSVRYDLPSLTIGRNRTKFGVRDFHMSGVCGSTFFWAYPLGPQGGFKGQLSDSKSQFQRFYTKLYVCSQR